MAPHKRGQHLGQHRQGHHGDLQLHPNKRKMKNLGMATIQVGHVIGALLGKAPIGKAPTATRRLGGAQRHLHGLIGTKYRRKRKDQNVMMDGKVVISIFKMIASWTGPRTVLTHAHDHTAVGEQAESSSTFSRIVTGPRTDYFKSFQLNRCSVNCALITLSDLQVSFDIIFAISE